MNTAKLDSDQMLKLAPSVFAMEPTSTVSNKYKFIPTTRVIDALGSKGWEPVFAAEQKSKKEENLGFQKHILKFRNIATPFHSNNGLVPEIVLTNSHNASSSFQLMSGIFRMVCGNGLIIASASFETISIHHVGFEDSAVIDAANQIESNIPKIFDRVNSYGQIQLDPAHQIAFAKSAMCLRWGSEDEAPITPEALLKVRRDDDKPRDLFTTYNVVQENLLKGGVRCYKADSNGYNKRKKARAVNGLSENVRLNKGLWTLTEEMAKLMK